MAISATDVVWTFTDGRAVPQGDLHAVFLGGRVGGATEYVLLEVRQKHATLTLSTVKAWVADPSGGAALAIALADTLARALSATWPTVDPAALAYSSPASKASGLTVPDLAPNTKALIAVRRTLAGASTAYPEVARVVVGGTSPL